MPYDPEREHAATSYRTKQLIVLASDVVLASVRMDCCGPAAVVEQLVGAGVLPDCYKDRYDERFLQNFHNVVEATRNSLVSDIPLVASTAAQLAARAILDSARRIVAERGKGWEAQAAEIDPLLAVQLELNGPYLAAELDALESEALEDSDILALFHLSAGHAVAEQLRTIRQVRGGSLLRFENWLVPFGNAPRPYITYDGRAWPTQL